MALDPRNRVGGIAKRMAKNAATLKAYVPEDKDVKVSTKTEVQPDSLLESLGKGVVESFARIPQTIGGLTQQAGETMGSRPSGFDKFMAPIAPIMPILQQVKKEVAPTLNIGEQIAKGGKGIAKRNVEWLEDKGLVAKGGKANEVAFAFGSGAGSLVQALAISAITKNPRAAAVVFGGIQDSDMYQRARAENKSVVESNQLALASGAVEGILEEIGLKVMFNSVGKNKIVGGILKVISKYANKVKPVVGKAITEATQEGLQTLSDNLFTNLGGVDKNREFLDGVGLSMFIGGVLGAGTSGIINLSNSKRLEAKLTKDFIDIGVEPKQAQEYAKQMNKAMADNVLDKVNDKATEILKEKRGSARISGDEKIKPRKKRLT